MTSVDFLPDDLYQPIVTLGPYAVPLDARPDQAEASLALRAALDSGSVEELPEALRGLGRAFFKNVEGERIPLSRNWVTRTGYQLADAIEAWLAEQKHASLGRAA